MEFYATFKEGEVENLQEWLFDSLQHNSSKLKL